ncbi:hypothetical protein AgCh_006815 [Apium graveolens]
MEHIRQRTRSFSAYYGVVQENEDQNQQWMENFRVPRGSIREYGVVQANQDEDQQGIEHIREAERSMCENEVVKANQHKGQVQLGVEHIREAERSMCENEVVQVNGDVNQQGIEHIQDRMLFFLMDAGGAQANEDQNRQEIEHVKKMLSVSFKLLKLGENDDLPGEEQETPRSDMLKVIKFLHDNGLDSARREVKRDFKKVNQNHRDISQTVQYVNKYLGLMLRLFDSATFQRSICNIMSKAQGDQVPCEHCKVVQANEGENHLGIEHFQNHSRSFAQWTENIQVPTRFSREYGVVQANQDEDQQGIEHIREAERSMCENEVVQVNGDVNQQEIEHIQDRMLFFLMDAGGAQANEDQNQQEIEHVKKILSVSFELLKLSENDDLPGEEQETPRSEMLKIIKFLHDKGLDSARHEVKRDLEKVNQNHYAISSTVQYVNKYLGLMFRMFDSATFQRTICNIMSKAEGDQVPCKHCKVVQANEGENHLGMEHIREAERSFAQWTENIQVPTRFIREYGVVQANQDEDQQGIEHIREAERSMCEKEVVQVNGDVNQQRIEHIKDRMLSLLKDAGGAQANEDQNLQEIEHIQNILLISFELLKLVENEDLPGEEQATPRFEVLKVIKFLHDKGLDSARLEVKRDLKKLNQNHHNISKTVSMFMSIIWSEFSVILRAL